METGKMIYRKEMGKYHSQISFMRDNSNKVRKMVKGKFLKTVSLRKQNIEMMN